MGKPYYIHIRMYDMLHILSHGQSETPLQPFTNESENNNNIMNMK